VGTPALRHAVTSPENTLFGVKRLIGRRFDDPEVQAWAKALPYAIDAAPNGDAWIATHGIPLAPPEISAFVLAELKSVAEEHLGDPVAEAIITVPAHFDNEQRRATVDAATIAGLKVRRLLNEPTAAALGYGAHRESDQRVAVCDLGGGTFDVSIVNVESGVIEVISTQGDLFLGGDDVDRAVIEGLLEDIRIAHGIDLADNATALQRLKEQVVRAKHALSETRMAHIELRFLATLASGAPLHYRRDIRREELARWMGPFLQRLEAPCREAAARCGLRADEIDSIILVGGMTRMPAIQDRIASIFGRPPLKVVNPDVIVSIGAATQCAILDGKTTGVVLLDVTSRALGLLPQGGRYSQVVPKNATIPTRQERIISTTENGQRELVFDVFEGESADPGRNRHLGRFVCKGLPDARAGDVLILVTFTVDVDGIIRVSASEMASGVVPELRMTATAGLARREVMRLLF